MLRNARGSSGWHPRGPLRRRQVALLEADESAIVEQNPSGRSRPRRGLQKCESVAIVFLGGVKVRRIRPRAISPTVRIARADSR